MQLDAGEFAKHTVPPGVLHDCGDVQIAHSAPQHLPGPVGPTIADRLRHIYPVQSVGAAPAVAPQAPETPHDAQFTPQQVFIVFASVPAPVPHARQSQSAHAGPLDALAVHLGVPAPQTSPAGPQFASDEHVTHVDRPTSAQR